MNNFRLERIPLPEFSTYLIYTAVSLVGSSFRLSYVLLQRSSYTPYTNVTVTAFKWTTSALAVEDPWFFWSFINFSYCILICAARELQHLFFGELREAESTNIRENFSNFIFYKVVFVYGILNVEALHELLLWAGWFSILGFLHLLTGLAKDRLEFVMQSCLYSVPPFRILCLLFCILICSNLLLAVSVAIGARHTLNLMFFMLAEVFQLVVKVLHVFVWYVMNLYSEVMAARWADENEVYHRSICLYYVNTIFLSVADFGDLLHYTHLLYWNGVRVNMSAIIVGMHLQHLYHKLSQRFYGHKRYQKLLRLLDTLCSLSNEPNQSCAVCWDKLINARRLPCGHAFHLSCLHVWMERSSDCPTCRTSFEFSAASVKSHPGANVKQPSLTQDNGVRSSHDTFNNEHHSPLQNGCFTETSSRFCAVPNECNPFDVDSPDYRNPMTVSAMVSINSFLNFHNESLADVETSNQFSRGPKLDRAMDHTPGAFPNASFHTFHPTAEQRERALEKRKSQMLSHAREQFF